MIKIVIQPTLLNYHVVNPLDWRWETSSRICRFGLRLNRSFALPAPWTLIFTNTNTSFNHYYLCVYEIIVSVYLFVIWNGVVEFYIISPLRNIRTKSFTPLLSLIEHPRCTSVQLLWNQTQNYWYFLVIFNPPAPPPFCS